MSVQFENKLRELYKVNDSDVKSTTFLEIWGSKLVTENAIRIPHRTSATNETYHFSIL